MATDLSKLSKEELEDILSRIANSGVDIAYYVDSAIPEDIKSISALLHNLLCGKNHLDGGCSFYKEVENCWEQPTHKEYLLITQKLIAYGFSIEHINKAINDLKDILKILEGASYYRNIVKLLLEKYLDLNSADNPRL